MSRPYLAGLGTGVPPLAIGQEDAARIAAAYGPKGPGQERVQRVLYRRTGVQNRASVALGLEDGTPGPGGLFPVPRDPEDRGPGTRRRLETYEREAPGLAARVARLALDDAGIGPEVVDQLLIVTCTGFMAPGLDVTLVRDLGLRRDVGRTQVGFMGCHGAFVGLRQAAALTSVSPASTALVVALELCSLHFQYGWDPAQIVANALFADGAAAAVVRGPETRQEEGGLSLGAHGSWLAEASEDAMTWHIGDHGFTMSLSAAVPGRIRDGLRGQIEPWLDNHGLALGDVATWAVHPGGPRILTAVSRALDLPDDALAVSRSVLAEHGNMSSPTILFILERLRRERAPGPWVALAFGPGLTTEAVLLV